MYDFSMMNSYYICDDYGLNETTNCAIHQLAQEQLITGISVMVTHINEQQPHESLKHVKKGLHLNLTEGYPVSEPSLVKSLLCSKGKFLGLRDLVLGIFLGTIKKSEINFEINAQIRKFLNVFSQIDHLDGHQHIQYFPILLKMINQSLNDLGKSNLRVRLSYFKNESIFSRYQFLNLLAVYCRTLHKTYSCKYIVDYNQCLNKSYQVQRDTEYFLHVAHPEVPGKDLDLTTFDFNLRVNQFLKKIDERRML